MTDRPDIIFVSPDQLRHDFVGCYRVDFLKTPAIDALAAAGTRYETCISPSPVCVPTRASMLSGQSAHAAGVMDNLHWSRPGRRGMGIRTWPKALADAGYHTAAVGKMHVKPRDISLGFAQRIIAKDKRHIHIEDDYDKALKDAGLRKRHGREQRGYAPNKGAALNDLPDALQLDRWGAAQVGDVIARARKDQPLALMVGFPGPHCPYDPPEAALAGVDPARLPPALPPSDESQSHRAALVASYKRDWADLDYDQLGDEHIHHIRHHYAALVERLDENVATILAALDSAGRRSNAIVVFASDHGDDLGDFGLVGKTCFHEPSIRVPLIVTDFRQPTASVRTAPVSLVDLYASFHRRAGLDVPPHADGIPLGAGRPGNAVDPIGYAWKDINKNAFLRARTNTLPDIMQVQGRFLPTIANIDQIQDLDAVFGKDTLEAQFPPGFLTMGQVGGKQVALPRDRGHDRHGCQSESPRCRGWRGDPEHRRRVSRRA